MGIGSRLEASKRQEELKITMDTSAKRKVHSNVSMAELLAVLSWTPTLGAGGCQG